MNEPGQRPTLVAASTLTAAQLHQCIKVVEETLGKNDACLFAQASLSQYEHGYTLLMQDDPACVLGVAAYRRPGLGYGTCSLSWLAVSPAHQGGGLGRSLVQAILDRDLWTEVFVASAIGAVGFYERLGFARLFRQERTWLMVRRVDNE